MHISANRRYVVFTTAGYTIMSRLIEGEFLNYHNVIPNGSLHHAAGAVALDGMADLFGGCQAHAGLFAAGLEPVSYTHLYRPRTTLLSSVASRLVGSTQSYSMA